MERGNPEQACKDSDSWDGLSVLTVILLVATLALLVITLITVRATLRNCEHMVANAWDQLLIQNRTAAGGLRPGWWRSRMMTVSADIIEIIVPREDAEPGTLKAYPGEMFEFPGSKIEVWFEPGRSASYGLEIDTVIVDSIRIEPSGSCTVTFNAYPNLTEPSVIDTAIGDSLVRVAYVGDTGWTYVRESQLSGSSQRIYQPSVEYCTVCGKCLTDTSGFFWSTYEALSVVFTAAIDTAFVKRQLGVYAPYFGVPVRLCPECYLRSLGVPDPSEETSPAPADKDIAGREWHPALHRPAGVVPNDTIYANSVAIPDWYQVGAYVFPCTTWYYPGQVFQPFPGVDWWTIVRHPSKDPKKAVR